MAMYTIDRNLDRSINESYELGNHYSAFAAKELIRALLTSRHLESEWTLGFKILDVRGEGPQTAADATVMRIALDQFIFDITIAMDDVR